MITDKDMGGVLIIYINPECLYSIVKQEYFDTMIINNDGFIVTSNNSSIINKNIRELNDFFINPDEKIWETDYNGNRCKIISDKIIIPTSEETFTIISAFPIDTILKRTKKVSFLGFSIIIVNLFLSLIFIFVFSNIFCKRIRYISKDMHKVALGDFNFVSRIKGKDEIGQLAQDLNKMIKSINKLINEVYDANLQKQKLIIKQKEIKFKMLASQINPHFLFNILETIRMRAHCEGNKEIANVIKLLGKLIRRNLEIKDELVYLEEELDFVKKYLQIQKFRFGEKINYSIKIDESMRYYKILPSIIQPVVENAIVHGIENKEHNGTIKITIGKTTNNSKISIIDDGVGMNSSRLNYVLKSLNSSENSSGSNIGISNVHHRIKLFYGEIYGLKIYSKLNKGTRVDIILPL